MGSSVFQFLSEMLAFAAVLLLLWGVFQLISYIWVNCAQINRRIQIRESLAEIEDHDRQIWAGA